MFMPESLLCFYASAKKTKQNNSSEVLIEGCPNPNTISKILLQTDNSMNERA